MKVSIIIPVYKVEPYIHRCVDSILNQTFTDFELILVDDGSPDNCGKICDEYAEKDNRIKVIHKQNGGLSDARNAGIDWVFANSDSEWITFIDSDDWVHKQYLEILYEICINNNVSISSCGHSLTDNYNDSALSNVIKYDTIIDDAQSIVKLWHAFTKFNYSTAWGRLYKKDLFKTVRYPKGRYHEDEYVTYKLLFECDRIAITTTALYYYFQNNSGIMISELTPKRMTDQLEAVYQQLVYYYTHNYSHMFLIQFYNNSAMIRHHLEKYGGRNEYDKVICKYLRLTKKYAKKGNEHMPYLIKKYGFSKWFYGRAEKIERLKNDINLVKKDKGLLYSKLWGIKSYFTEMK